MDSDDVFRMDQHETGFSGCLEGGNKSKYVQKMFIIWVPGVMMMIKLRCTNA